MEAIPVSIALTQNTHNTDTYYCTQSLLQTHWLHNRQIAGIAEPSDKLPLAEGGSSIKPIGANNFISTINHDGGELFRRYFFMMMKTMPWVLIVLHIERSALFTRIRMHAMKWFRKIYFKHFIGRTKINLYNQHGESGRWGWPCFIIKFTDHGQLSG